jgi:transcriptional regulator with XRE-family HTH domain
MYADDDDVNVEVGRRIRARRNKLRLTQTQLADKSNGDFNQSAIAMYERGERAMTVAKLVRMAEALGLSSTVSLIPKPDEL